MNPVCHEISLPRPGAPIPPTTSCLSRGGRLFPFCRQALQLIGDRREFAIDRHRATARFVDGRIFQLQRQLFLLTFECGDVHFQLAHALLAFALLFRQRFAHFRFGALLRFLFAQARLVAGGADPGLSLAAAGCNRLPIRQARPAVSAARSDVGLRFIKVILVIAGVRGELAGVDVQDAARNRADEMHVVTDENERPFGTA